MKKVSLVLTVAIALLVILLYWQNRDTQLTLVIWGQPLLPLSLSTILVVFYAIGAGLGALIVASWRLQDRVQQGRLRRQLNQLLDRIDRLEGRQFASDVLPPSARRSPFISQDEPPIVEPDIVDDDDMAPDGDDWR